MSSPARRHFELHSAMQSKAAESDSPRDANGYELMLHKLAEDKRRLKGVQSMELKADVKREILPEYEPWIDGVLAGKQGVQDDVMVTVMVWRIDAGDLTGALTIARYVIEHKLSMPDQYARSAACLIAEEFADIALKATPETRAEYGYELNEVLTLTENQDMPDEVRAKVFKACGYALTAVPDENITASDMQRKQTALAYLQRALSLHAKCGVKKDIEKLEREIKNLNTAADIATTAASLDSALTNLAATSG